MNLLSSLGRKDKDFRAESPEVNGNAEKFVRISKKNILQQILLLVGLGCGFSALNGCTNLSPQPSQEAPTSATTPSPPQISGRTPTVSRNHAVLERTSEDPTDFDWLLSPINLTLNSTEMLIHHRSDNLRQITFDERPSARQYAIYEREDDFEGDIQLRLYHYRETYEWPSSEHQPPSHELIREGRLALGDWIFDHTRDQIMRVAESREFESSRPRLLWNEQIRVDENIDLRLSFDLLQSPRENPMALARMTDNVSQLLAFASEKATPENRHLRAIIRPLWLFMYHVLGRMSAHYAHETAHGFGEDLEMMLSGYRTLNGIPSPPVFPQVTFEDKNGILQSIENEESTDENTEPDNESESLEMVSARERLLQALVNGPNQHTLHNRLMYERNLRNPHAMSTYDAWTYLIQNNLMPGSAPLGYMLSDQKNRRDENSPGDINRYLRLLREKGMDVEMDRMIRNKIMTLLSTADSYQAVIALINEVIGLVNDLTGLNLSRLPSLPRGVRMLGADIHWPLVEHYLTRDGEIMNIILPINPNGQYPVTFEFGTDLDSTQRRANSNFLRGGLTLGYRNRWFTIEGGGAIATHRDEVSQIRALTGIGRLTIPIPESGVSFTFQVVHQKQMSGEDYMNTIQGFEDGTNATILLCFDW